MTPPITKQGNSRMNKTEKDKEAIRRSARKQGIKPAFPTGLTEKNKAKKKPEEAPNTDKHKTQEETDPIVRELNIPETKKDQLSSSEKASSSTQKEQEIPEMDIETI